MIQVLSISGGLTSARAGVMLKAIYGDNLNLVFMDTGGEHPETYKFLREINEHFNLNITCLKGDFTGPLGSLTKYHIISIDDIGPDLSAFTGTVQKYGVPYTGGMFCTSRMKTRVYEAYCNKTYGRKNYITWLGIRADEPGRVWGEKAMEELKPLGLDNDELIDMYNNVKQNPELAESLGDSCVQRIGVNTHLRYIAEIDDADKRDVINWWSHQPFTLNIPEWLGNCVFCPKKSDLKLALAYRDEPEMFIKFNDMLNDKSVRVDDKTGVSSDMYRKHRSLTQVIDMYEDYTYQEIRDRMRYTGGEDTNSCSESCEIFGGDDAQFVKLWSDANE